MIHTEGFRSKSLGISATVSNGSIESAGKRQGGCGGGRKRGNDTK